MGGFLQEYDSVLEQPGALLGDGGEAERRGAVAPNGDLFGEASGIRQEPRGLTEEEDDVVETSLSTVEKDLRIIVGNMFEIRRSKKGKPIIKIPTRLLTGDRSQPAYKDKDLKKYIDSKGPWKDNKKR